MFWFFFLSTFLICPLPPLFPAVGGSPCNCYGLMNWRTDRLSAGRLWIDPFIQQSSFIGLAGIKFDYGLLIADGLDLVARGNAHHYAFESFFVQRHPIGHRPAGGAFQILGRQLPRGIGILDLYNVVHLEAKRRNIDLAPIDLHVPMRHQLPGGRARIGETEMIGDIVQPGLQNLQHVFARNPSAPQRAFVNASELALEQAIIITKLLLLNQAQPIVGVLAARLRAMHARTVIAALEVFRRAEDRNTEAAADANAGTSITSHLLKK